MIEVILLAYSNDILVLADFRVDLERKITTFAEYCKINHLEVDITKMKTMVFHNGRKPLFPNFTLDVTHLEIVREYNYVGKFFQELSFLRPGLHQKYGCC